MDDLKCEICGKSFNTNAGLYTHKQKMHDNPSVVLVNHNRHRDDHWRPRQRKRESKPESEFSDRYIHPPKRERNDEGDSGLKVIDEYNYDDGDAELDDDMEIISEDDSTDEDDENPPSPPNSVQPPIPSSQLNYKVLYEKCRRNYNKMKLRCKKKLDVLSR